MSSLLPPRCVEAMDNSWSSFHETEDSNKRVYSALSYVINLKTALTFHDTEGHIRNEPVTHEFYAVCMEHLKEHMGIDRWDAFTTFHGYDKVLDR